MTKKNNELGKPKAISDEPLEALKIVVKEMEELQEKTQTAYNAVIQSICNKHSVMLATGHMSTTWQFKKLRGRYWKDDIDEPNHPVFTDLLPLNNIVEESGIGPRNGEFYSPSNKSNFRKSRN